MIDFDSFRSRLNIEFCFKWNFIRSIFVDVVLEYFGSSQKGISGSIFRGSWDRRTPCLLTSATLAGVIEMNSKRICFVYWRVRGAERSPRLTRISPTSFININLKTTIDFDCHYHYSTSTRFHRIYIYNLHSPAPIAFQLEKGSA